VSDPKAELDTRFSDKEAMPTEWAEARGILEEAEVFWISTVRPDGRPHVTPLIAVWLDDALHIVTGPGEQKAKNLAENPHCILTTGTNAIGEGLDLVVEGEAVRVTDEAKLQRLADLFVSKYGEDWRFDVREGGFVHAGGHEVGLVFAVAPTKAFGFRKGDEFSQTRWRFGP
jgi:nitroimidazol reductase NimA-like FMN-containing flavoprotein (pyridoxamine 5'-phosphate oxidase superfamily)